MWYHQTDFVISQNLVCDIKIEIILSCDIIVRFCVSVNFIQAYCVSDFSLIWKEGFVSSFYPC